MGSGVDVSRPIRFGFPFSRRAVVRVPGLIAIPLTV